MSAYDDLIGVPFAWNGRGPDAFDCYGLVMHLFRTEQGVTLPDFGESRPTTQAETALLMQNSLPRWTRLDGPERGCVVYMRIHGAGSHVGYVIDPRRFIHVWQDSGGVCIERLGDWQRRVVGYYRFNS
jgi:cell wall-associated NlpC family hydrolase